MHRDTHLLDKHGVKGAPGLSQLCHLQRQNVESWQVIRVIPQAVLVHQGQLHCDKGSFLGTSLATGYWPHSGPWQLPGTGRV